MRKAHIISNMVSMIAIYTIAMNALAIPAIPTQLSGSSLQTNGQVGKPVPPPIQPMSADDYNKAVQSMSTQNQPQASNQPNANPAPTAAPANPTNGNGNSTPSTAPTQPDVSAQSAPVNTVPTTPPVPATFGGAPGASAPQGTIPQNGAYSGFGSGGAGSTPANSPNSSTTNQNSGGWNIKY